MPLIGGELRSKVVLKEATLSYQSRKVDYSRTTTVPVLAVRGDWHTGSPLDHYSSTYYFEAQPFSVEVIIDGVLTEKLLDECYRITGLHDVHDVKMESTRFCFAYHHDHDDNQTFQVVIRGVGHHSRVMWDASPFEVKRLASPVAGAILRDIILAHLNLDMGLYPQKG